MSAHEFVISYVLEMTMRWILRRMGFFWKNLLSWEYFGGSLKISLHVFWAQWPTSNKLKIVNAQKRPKMDFSQYTLA